MSEDRLSRSFALTLRRMDAVFLASVFLSGCGPVMTGSSYAQQPATGYASGMLHGGLTDPDSVAAEATLAGTVANYRRDCPNDRIKVTMTEAILARGVPARAVELTSLDGNCFGQPGKNTYLLAQLRGSWQTMLAAEPGSIRALPTRHNGFADLELAPLPPCVLTYRWNGRAYVRASGRNC